MAAVSKHKTGTVTKQTTGAVSTHETGTVTTGAVSKHETVLDGGSRRYERFKQVILVGTLKFERRSKVILVLRITLPLVHLASLCPGSREVRP